MPAPPVAATRPATASRADRTGCGYCRHLTGGTAPGDTVADMRCTHPDLRPPRQSFVDAREQGLTRCGPEMRLYAPRAAD